MGVTAYQEIAARQGLADDAELGVRAGLGLFLENANPVSGDAQIWFRFARGERI